MTTKAATAFQPDWVSPPGDTISDLLEERGWTQAELANRTGFTTKHINLLITGKAAITEETALKLERVLGSTAQFWLRREAQYREALARNEENEEFREEASWLKELPLTDMIRFRWVQKKDDKAEQVRECLSFFGLASVSRWNQSTYANPCLRPQFRALRMKCLSHLQMCKFLVINFCESPANCATFKS